MADETRSVIIDVEVESKDFDKEIGSINTSLKQNQQEIKELSKDYENNATRIAELQATNRDLAKSKQQLVKESRTEANSLDALRLKTANLTKERNGLDRSSQEGEKRFQELNKEILANTESLKEAEEAGGDFRRNVGNYGSALDRVIPGFSGLTQGIQASTRAALAFIATPLGLILGGIALAIAAVTSAFRDSEEGQNRFAEIMGVINVILGNFQDLLADLGEEIIDAFSNPGESIQAFGKLILENITNRFEGLIELIPNLAKAVTLLFEGNFAEAGEVALNAVVKVGLGVADITTKISDAAVAVAEFAQATIREGNEAILVAQKRAEADILARDLLIERAKIESEIALLRLQSRQEDELTAEQRKQALLDAQVLEDELLVKEKEVLQLRSDAQTLENTFSRSTKENLDAEAQAIAAVSQVEAARLNQQRQTQRELNRLNKEILANISREEKAEVKAFEDTIKRIAAEQDAKEKAAKEEEAREKELREVKKEIGESVLETTIDALGESSRVGKIAATIQAGINVAEAVTKALASAPPPFNFIAAGAVGAAGAIQIAKINRANTIGSNGSSVGSPSAGSSSLPPDIAAIVNRTPETVSNVSDPVQSEQAQVQGVSNAVSNIPAPQVAVVDINEAQSNRAVKLTESNLA